MKRRLMLCMILVFVPLLLLLSYAMSQRSFSLSMQQETQRTQLMEGMIATDLRNAANGLTYEELQLLAAQYRRAYSTQNIELAFLYNGYPMDELQLENRNYEDLLISTRAAMLDTRSSPQLYTIADPITEQLTLLLLQDVSGLYHLRSQMRQTFLIWGLGAAVVMAVLSWMIASWFTRPVKQLMKAAKQLSTHSGGACELPTDRKDELGSLAVSFSDMQQAVREREDKLQQESSNRQALLDALAHEMRTPLCSLLGNTRLLENPAIPSEQKESILSRMAQEIKRLSDMDEQLLKLVNMRHEAIDMLPIQVLPLLQESAQRLQSQTYGVELQVAGEDDILLGDRTLLSIMVDNLVVNALRASTSGQCVYLRATNGGFSVTDTGIGMSEEQRAHAFDAFYKGDKSRTRTAGGAGLGLSICQRVAQVHGGTLTLTSTPGEGTAATFTTLLQLGEDSVTSSGVSLAQEVERV